MSSKFDKPRFWLDGTSRGAQDSHGAPTVGADNDVAYAAFMAEHLGAPDTEEYHAQKQEAFSSGALTWFARNPDAEQGIVFDLFAAKAQVGYVDFSDGIAEVYIYDDAGEPILAEAFDSGDTATNLATAVGKLEAYAQVAVTQD